MAGKHQDSYKNDNPASNTALNSPGCNRNLATDLSATCKPAVCLYMDLYTPRHCMDPPPRRGRLFKTQNTHRKSRNLSPHKKRKRKRKKRKKEENNPIAAFPSQMSRARQQHRTTLPTVHSHKNPNQQSQHSCRQNEGIKDHLRVFPVHLGCWRNTCSCPCHCRPG